MCPPLGRPPPPPPSFPGTLVRERMCARRDTRHARMCLRTHAFSAHVSAPGLTPCGCAFPVPACGPGRALLFAALRSAPPPSTRGRGGVHAPALLRSPSPAPSGWCACCGCAGPAHSTRWLATGWSGGCDPFPARGAGAGADARTSFAPAGSAARRGRGTCGGRGRVVAAGGRCRSWCGAPSSRTTGTSSPRRSPPSSG